MEGEGALLVLVGVGGPPFMDAVDVAVALATVLAATKACSRMACSFCRRAEEPLEGGVSAPLPKPMVGRCVLGVRFEVSSVLPSLMGIMGGDVGLDEDVVAAVAVGGGPDVAFDGGPEDDLVTGGPALGDLGGDFLGEGSLDGGLELPPPSLPNELLLFIGLLVASASSFFGDLVFAVGNKLPGRTGLGRRA